MLGLIMEEGCPSTNLLRIYIHIHLVFFPQPLLRQEVVGKHEVPRTLVYLFRLLFVHADPVPFLSKLNSTEIC